MSSDRNTTAPEPQGSGAVAATENLDVEAWEATGPPADVAVKPSRPWRKYAEIAFFVIPAIAVFVTFVIWPVLQAARFSLYRWNGLGPLDNFVGFDNYARALADPAFQLSLRNNILLVIVSILVQLPLAIGIALLLNRKLRGRSMFRLMIFVPYVISEVVTGVVFYLLLQPRGAISQVAGWFGIDNPPLWLADPNIVAYTMFAVITWKYLGLAIILLLAGMQGIPHELTEAAAIDGASWWQTQRRITIPLLGPTIRIWMFLSMIGSLQLFDLVWIMTGGGPANQSSTMAVYMYLRGFFRQELGYGTAVALILFAISLVFALFYQRAVLRRDTQGALTGRAN